MNYKKMKAVMITRPDGTEMQYPSQSDAARNEHIHQTYISELCRKVKQEYRGYKARFHDEPGSQVSPPESSVAAASADHHGSTTDAGMS